jgi:hypothetical protein
MTADFKRALAVEQADTRRPELQALLKLAFPDATGMKIIADIGTQMSGVDAIIHRPSGNVSVDFKFRSEKQDYEDFCLEYSHSHDDGRITPGWVADQSKVCDYFAYIRKKGWRLALLPRERLHLAWTANEKMWLSSCVSKRTRNKTYWTNWCAVPRSKLLKWMKILDFSLPQIDETPDPELSSTLVKGCQQCGGLWDGTQRQILICGFIRWLHPQCEKIFLERVGENV